MCRSSTKIAKSFTKVVPILVSLKPMMYIYIRNTVKPMMYLCIRNTVNILLVFVRSTLL